MCAVAVETSYGHVHAQPLLILMRIEMDTPMKNALILVDIQSDYFAGGKWPVANITQAAENAARPIGSARANCAMIVHVHHETPEGGPFFAVGIEGVKISRVVAPLDNELKVLKHRPNSFHDTGLEAMPRDAGVTSVAICGAMSQMCIDSTTRATPDLGFDVTVVEDTCGAQDTTFGNVTLPAE